MKQQRGFTLVELSIVLVILGLLIGGVLTGQSLIRAAELRSVSTQYQRYSTAVNTFRDKYMGLPADLPTATSYWGAAAAGTSCVGTAGTGTQTCNGDGDGKIGFTSTNSNELYRFWQHLANAGLIEGNYDGITHGSTSSSSTLLNSPQGRIASSLWFVGDYVTVSTGYAFDGVYNNSFLFGGIMANNTPGAPIFKPEDAYNIDTKLDDGKPATGKVVIQNAANLGACTDTTTSSVLTANYLLSSAALGCALVFRQQF